jgi:hypothetical protein
MNDIFIDALFSIMFALVPLIALALLPHARISLRRFSIPSLLVIFYLLFDYIGILPLYFKLDLLRVSQGSFMRTMCSGSMSI